MNHYFPIGQISLFIYFIHVKLGVRMWSTDQESKVQRTIVITGRYRPPILTTSESMIWFALSYRGSHDQCITLIIPVATFAAVGANILFKNCLFCKVDECRWDYDSRLNGRRAVIWRPSKACSLIFGLSAKLRPTKAIRNSSNRRMLITIRLFNELYIAGASMFRRCGY